MKLFRIMLCFKFESEFFYTLRSKVVAQTSDTHHKGVVFNLLHGGYWGAVTV